MIVVISAVWLLLLLLQYYCCYFCSKVVVIVAVLMLLASGLGLNLWDPDTESLHFPIEEKSFFLGEVELSAVSHRSAVSPLSR